MSGMCALGSILVIVPDPAVQNWIVMMSSVICAMSGATAIHLSVQPQIGKS